MTQLFIGMKDIPWWLWLVAGILAIGMIVYFLKYEKKHP